MYGAESLLAGRLTGFDDRSLRQNCKNCQWQNLYGEQRYSGVKSKKKGNSQNMRFSDWDVDMFDKALNDVAFRFEEILTENTRLRKKATRCLFRKKRTQSKKQSVYGRSEMDELRMMFWEMTTRVQEIVQENNELNEQLEQSENRNRQHIDQLNSLSVDRHKLHEKIISLERASEQQLKDIGRLEALKEEMSRELSDVKSELKFTENNADTIEKEKFEFELKVEILEEKRKELEEKLAKYKKVDMEAFSLRKTKGV
ncbi:uncharacterized protein [Ptychodera flava]|uniref:uncharacterized protein n=1 Tax=Ptychodera flava TaxID=63121 RepID=UPI00396A4B97